MALFDVRIAETVRRVRTVTVEAEDADDAKAQAESGFWEDADDAGAVEQVTSREAFDVCAPYEDGDDEDGDGDEDGENEFRR